MNIFYSRSFRSWTSCFPEYPVPILWPKVRFILSFRYFQDPYPHFITRGSVWAMSQGVVKDGGKSIVVSSSSCNDWELKIMLKNVDWVSDWPMHLYSERRGPEKKK